MIYTTLNKIRAHGPCSAGWAKLLRYLGKTQDDDEPVSLLTILNSNGLDDAIWCLRAVDGHQREMRLYTVWCAKQVQHLMTDPRSLAALDVAERHANGEATDEELFAAWAAAWAAASVAASVAAKDAASAAERDAELFAAWAAASVAASVAAKDAASAAERDAEWAAASAAARDAQAAEFRRVFCGEEKA